MVKWPSGVPDQERGSSRDRVIDAVRGFSLVAVVVGHSALLVVAWPPGGGVAVGNLLSVEPQLGALTWFFQVIPLFFVAGGAASVRSWQASRGMGVGYAGWLWGRLRRLYRPVLVYLAVMSVVAVVCIVLVGRAADPLLAIACQMLWFLGIYVLTTMALPAMSRIPGKAAWVPFAVGLMLVTVLDAGVQFMRWPAWLALANFLVVWLVVQQLGVLWNSSPGSRRWLVWGMSCVVTAMALVILGPWPVSLVGVPGEVISNMAPPSIVLLCYGLGIGCVVIWARPALSRWLARPWPWTVTAALSGSAMTIYLWHVPAIGASVLSLRTLGYPPPTAVPASGFPIPVSAGAYAWWWLTCLAMAVVILFGLVVVLRRVEWRPWPWWDAAPRPTASTPAGAVLLSVVAGSLVAAGTLMVSIVGLSGFPTGVVTWNGIPLNPAVAMIVILAGLILARAASGSSGSWRVTGHSPST